MSDCTCEDCRENIAVGKIEFCRNKYLLNHFKNLRRDIHLNESEDLLQLFGYNNISKFYVEVWKDGDNIIYMVGGKGGSNITDDIREVVKFIEERK